jgi:hypothetical protein
LYSHPIRNQGGISHLKTHHLYHFCSIKLFRIRSILVAIRIQLPSVNPVIRIQRLEKFGRISLPAHSTAICSILQYSKFGHHFHEIFLLHMTLQYSIPTLKFFEHLCLEKGRLAHLSHTNVKNHLAPGMSFDCIMTSREIFSPWQSWLTGPMKRLSAGVILHL